MILTQQPTGDQMINTKWTCTTFASVIKPSEEEQVKDFCLCDFECDFEELSFTNIEDENNSYENDYRKFLVNPSLFSSNYNFFLVKNGVDIPFTTNYGEVYAQGFNTEQPKQAGINVLWWKVAKELGHGKYKIKIELEEIGDIKTAISHTFNVVPFNTRKANRTVKIEVINKGFTMNGLDYSGLGDFVNMVRVSGILSKSDAEIEISNLEDSNRILNNNQVKKRNTYVLNIENIPSNISDVLIDEGVLMNWKITDYNMLNHKDYRDIVLEVSGSSVEQISQNTRRFYEVSLRDIVEKVSRKYII